MLLLDRMVFTLIILSEDEEVRLIADPLLEKKEFEEIVFELDSSR